MTKKVYKEFLEKKDEFIIFNVDELKQKLDEIKINSIKVDDGDVIRFKEGIVTFLFNLLHYAHICGTNNFIHTNQLFNAMCTPADDTGDGKHCRVKLYRYSEHIVNKTAVKVNIRAYSLENAALACNDLGCKLFNIPI